ncbi:hypothetical protein [Hymenobacter sp.]|jgi:hypothetical protein|uniref:hypothetical protein n=1 Tax=Hymenobacter sp. TaxID=1898978 RepID=UPI002EDA673A
MAGTQLLVYFNPAHETVRGRLQGAVQKAPLQLLDAVGRIVRTKAALAVGTGAELSLAELRPGLSVRRCGLLNQHLVVE